MRQLEGRHRRRRCGGPRRRAGSIPGRFLEVTESVLMRDAKATVSSSANSRRSASDRDRRLRLRPFLADLSPSVPDGRVKIDRSFIADMDEQASGGTLPYPGRAGPQPRVATVAEGIEVSPARRPPGPGMRTAGFIFARPVHPNAIEPLLSPGGRAARASCFARLGAFGA